MNKELEEFINLKDERKNSAYAKLKLLIYGVKDAPEVFGKFQDTFKEEHYAYDNGNWGVDKKRLTPTELLLPGGIVSKLHIRPDSPLTLKEDSEKLYILLENKVLSEFRFLPRPNFWNVGTGCRVCSVKSTVSGDNPIEVKKSPEELADVCELATKYDDINYIIVTGGSHLNQDEEFQAHLDVIKAIKDKLPWGGKIKGNISMMPPKDLKKLDELYINKVENPSFNMEAWPKENF